MIHESPVKISHPCLIYMRKIFLTRVKAHYQFLFQNLRVVINYWAIYVYVIIGLIICPAALTVFHASNSKGIHEVHLIYLSTIIVMLSFQFSIKYFLHPADLIHFIQRKELLFKLRKYAIIHAVFSHIIYWAVIFMLLSPIYLYISGQPLYRFVCLFLFSITFTMVTSMMNKEYKFNLRLNHKPLYPYFFFILIAFLFIWYIIIFCFADYLYILVGSIVNISIYAFTYQWGKRHVFPTLKYLIDHEYQHNMLSITIINYVPQKGFTTKASKVTPRFIKSTFHFFKRRTFRTVWLEILVKKLLRTSSYLFSMTFLYVVTILGVLMVNTLMQFLLLSVLTFYISFLIHKQHVEYLKSHIILRNYLKQGLTMKGTELKLTLYLTTPVIILLFLFYKIINSYL